MTDRYFSYDGLQWRCSVANTPGAPASRHGGRTRLYFWSQAGVMRSVVFPSTCRLSHDEFMAIPDEQLCQLLVDPKATEMGRLTILQDT
jgi:hypothetical protein